MIIYSFLFFKENSSSAYLSEWLQVKQLRNGRADLYVQLSQNPKFLLLVHAIFFIFIYLLLLLCWVGVYCGNYKSSYNLSSISSSNLPPPSFSFIPHPCLEQFQQVSFFLLHICVHSTCTIYTHVLFHPFSPPKAAPVPPFCYPIL
jgi:hypothetical protein